MGLSHEIYNARATSEDPAYLAALGITPLMMEVSFPYLGWEQRFDSAIKNGCDLFAKHQCGETAICLAAGRFGQVKRMLPQTRREVTEWLQRAGRSASGFNEIDIWVASQFGYADRLKTLIGSGQTVNQVDSAGNSPLMYAAECGNAEAVKQLLDSGADVRQANEDGDIALHLAGAAGHAKVVALLLDSGSDVNFRGGTPDPKWKESVIETAAGNGALEVVKVLLARGAKDAKKALRAARDSEEKAVKTFLKQWITGDRIDPDSSP